MCLCCLHKWSAAFYLAPIFNSHHSRAQTHRVKAQSAMHQVHCTCSPENFRLGGVFFFNSLGLNHTLQPPLHTCNQWQKHISTRSSRHLQLLQWLDDSIHCPTCMLTTAPVHSHTGSQPTPLPVKFIKFISSYQHKVDSIREAPPQPHLSTCQKTQPQAFKFWGPEFFFCICS